MDNSNYELNCKWSFPDMPDNGSIVGPNEPMAENFKKTPYASLVREAIQNSLDERLDKTKPLEMNFSIKKLSLERFPNFREIHQHLIGCKNLSGKASDTYSPMVEYIKGVVDSPSKELYYIQVSDYNANGMPFNEDNQFDTNSPFVAFVRSAGLSTKSTANAGGSFGFGKAAYFYLSPIRTILVSTYTKDNKYYFEGVSSLCTHECDGIRKMHIGYYDSRDGFPITDIESIPRRFRRIDQDGQPYGYGTDIYIMGLRYDKSESITQVIHEIYEEMTLAVLRNFWMAIYEGLLSVKIGDTLINQENLLSVMNRFFNDNPDDNSKRITDYNPLPYLQMVINAKNEVANHKICVIEAGDADPDSKCVLFLQKKKTANDRILYMRSPRMLVKADTKRNRRGYYGVFICTGGIWDRLLRSIENPAHSEWDKENFDGDRKIAREIEKYLQQIFSFVRDKVDELFASSNSSEDTIKDLEQYLYIPTDVDENDDDFVQESLTSNPTGEFKDDGTSMTSDSQAIQTPKLPSEKHQIGVVLQPIVDNTKPDPNGERLSGNGGSKGGAGGGMGTRYINQRNVITKDPKVEKTTTLSRVPVKYRSFAQSVNGRIVHKLVIHSDYDIENGRVDLSVGTEEGTEQIIIREAKPGIARDNTITGLKIMAGRPNAIEIYFADNMKHSIILEAYEIK